MTPWYFLIPIIVIHFIVIAIPSILSLALCFTDWNGFGKINFIGLDNFYELFNDRVFKLAVWHNLIWTILGDSMVMGFFSCVVSYPFLFKAPFTKLKCNQFFARNLIEYELTRRKYVTRLTFLSLVYYIYSSLKSAQTMLRYLKDPFSKHFTFQ